MTTKTEPSAVDFRPRRLYRIGGAAALLIAPLLLGEVVVYVVFPRTETALEHFELFQENWLVGLLMLDLLGIFAYLLFIPTMLALFAVLRKTDEAVSAIATTLFIVGIATFFATNTAFSVLSLSDQYAAATTDDERAM
jgi:hypothetical protein